MSPSERLKEIEKNCNFGVCTPEALWIISRIHILEKYLGESLDALEFVRSRMEEAPYKDQIRVTATSVQIGIFVKLARAALKGEKG